MQLVGVFHTLACQFVVYVHIKVLECGFLWRYFAFGWSHHRRAGAHKHIVEAHQIAAGGGAIVDAHIFGFCRNGVGAVFPIAVHHFGLLGEPHEIGGVGAAERVTHTYCFFIPLPCGVFFFDVGVGFCVKTKHKRLFVSQSGRNQVVVGLRCRAVAYAVGNIAAEQQIFVAAHRRIRF